MSFHKDSNLNKGEGLAIGIVKVQMYNMQLSCKINSKKKQNSTILSDQRKLTSAEKPRAVETYREVARVLIGARSSQ